MKCPHCNKKLVSEIHEGEPVDICTSCKGMWLRRNQLNHMLKDSGGDVESCSIDDNTHRDRHPKIKCLECADTTMKKVNFLDYSKIIMDYCPTCHSFWLDKGELSQIKEYMDNIEEGTHEVKDHSAYRLLVDLSKMAFSIFR